jgi:radical SAM protein with 4Fe4S-binding SPASM domain
VSGVKVDEKQDKQKFNQFWAKLVDYNVLVDLQERWDTYMNAVLPDEKLLPCGDIFERMYIWWDGKVNPCDVDYKSTLGTGDVTQNTIQEIWNGPAYTKLREKHLNGQRGEFSVCSKCSNFTQNGRALQ